MPGSDAFDERLLESIPLPDGVTPQQWAEEKTHWQNPRIRALLGCSALLDTVYESNQAILNCSPDRLGEIWATVRQVAHLLSDEVMPLLESRSVVPRLEEARQRARAGAPAERREAGESTGDPWERALVERLRELLAGLDGLLKDLRAFLPLWRQGIGNRRALAFRRLESGEPGTRFASK